tara:strand:- start:579 stop:824 length:246 start_codon:yes stop_codon:yes gene_type:complete
MDTFLFSRIPIEMENQIVQCVEAHRVNKLVVNDIKDRGKWVNVERELDFGEDWYNQEDEDEIFEVVYFFTKVYNRYKDFIK